MSSIKKLFKSRAKDFELGIKRYQDSEVTVPQVVQLYKDFITIAKECIQENQKDQEDINVIMDIIYKFLHCGLDYVGVGSMTFKLTHLKMFCHEVYRAIFDLQLIHNFMKQMSIPVFEILFQPETQSWIAKEVLKMYSIIIQLIDRPVRSALLEENFIYYIARLMDMLPLVDFEFQAIIMEVLFRLYTQDEIKNKKNIFFFETEKQRKAFYSIDTNNFDFSIRLYLNVVNNIGNNIKSILCHKVCMDEYELHAPDELSLFKGLWVDFNIKVGSISFYIDIRGYFDESKIDNTMWDIVTNITENISSAEISIEYNKEKEIQEAIGKIKLKGPCIMVRQVPKKLFNATTITMYSTNVEKMKNIFNIDIPKMTKKRTKRHFVELNRRGYKPLDIISIKSSGTNYSSELNCTINEDIVHKNSSKNRGSIKKSNPSVGPKEQNEKGNPRNNRYAERVTSQLIEMFSDSNDKHCEQSYSYSEAFAIKEVHSQNKNVKIDKNPCGYGEKFISSLMANIDDLFKEDAISNEIDVPTSSTNKKGQACSGELYPMVLRSRVRNNEQAENTRMLLKSSSSNTIENSVSKQLNKKKVKRKEHNDYSSSEHNHPKNTKKKPLRSNKKQGPVSSSQDSEKHELQVEKFELFQTDFPDIARDDCKLDPFDELILEIPNHPIQMEEKQIVDCTIEEPVPIKIAEVGDMVSQDTDLFETARMNIDSVELRETNLYLGESPKLQSEDKLSNEDNLSLDIKKRIRILANIKVQSATDNLSKSIRNSRECENYETHGLGSQAEFEDKKSAKISSQNTRSSQDNKEINEKQSQVLVSSKLEKINQLILPCDEKSQCDMKIQEDIRQSEQQKSISAINEYAQEKANETNTENCDIHNKKENSEERRSLNFSGDYEMIKSINETENKHHEESVTQINESIKKKTNDTCSQGIENELKPEKLKQKRNLLQDNNCTDSQINIDLDNLASTSITDSRNKRRKLFNPDFPNDLNFNESEKVNEQTNISETHKKVGGKPEIERTLEYPKTKLSRSIKNKTVDRTKTSKYEKNWLNRNKEKNSGRSKDFKRLDKQFQEVLQRLKSGDYLKKKSPSPKKISNKLVISKENVYNLDFSDINADFERRNLKKKRNIESDIIHFGKEVDCSRNYSKKDNCNAEGKDREIQGLLKAFGQFCGKLGSGQVRTPNPDMKKKLIAVSHVLLDI